MKITGVETIELRLPEKEIHETRYTSAQDAVIVKVHTDEGIVGIGDSYSSPHVVKAMIEAPLSGASASGLARLIVGMNPMDIKPINHLLQARNIRMGRRGLICHAIAAIDIALGTSPASIITSRSISFSAAPFKRNYGLTPAFCSARTAKQPRKSARDGWTRASPR